MKTAVVLLAAGQGKRMRSSLPKVLHRICGTTMLQSVISSARKLKPDKIIVVAGRHKERIRDAVGDEGVYYALQKDPRGTGHALSCARPALNNFDGDILVLNADTPLIGPATLKRLVALHRRQKNLVSVLSFTASDPAAYGRIVRGRSGQVCAIIEDREAGPEEKKIREVNSGVYVLGRRALSLLTGISEHRSTGEYYLTDIVAAASKRGEKVAAYPIGREDEFMGVNTREELGKASEMMRKALVKKWTERGVTFLDPDSAFIHPDVSIGSDTVIYPNVFLEEKTVIGKNSIVYPNVRIRNGRIGNSVSILDSTLIEDSVIKEGASVGPFSHIRPGSIVGRGAKIGNFVELKKALLGSKTKASHLSYLGDALIGRDVNIGAGTITCNYDGANKNVTTIGDGVFVGSDSQLVAPVKIGNGAYIGAGSTITADVPSDALAVARVRQKNIRDWAKRMKKRKARR